MERSVAVCGLGGLGSNVAVMLARAGVKKLHIIDFDRVDMTNLDRQYYFRRNIGEYKTSALENIIHDIGADTEVIPHCARLDGENIADILKNDDIICECLDGADEKAELVNAVLEKFPEKYIISATGMAGLYSANNIRTRRITDKFYICGDGTSDMSEGIYSPRVMLCASHQANAVLRILKGESENE
ncbi:MAG: sulfur carrier protein ThiS adenylyltransferase ThiF [Ruminococcus sp.]|nr:sulfur carrier protein ThiS adenylyltransferase ThiF [Ruminococcus sp.]